MNRRLVGSIILPIHERLCGRETFRYFNELMKSQWWTAAEVHVEQTRKLANLFRHAVRNIPFYRQIFEQQGITPDDDPWSILARLPFMDKVAIRENFDQLLWPQTPGGLQSAFTGGSTGETLHFHLDRRRQGYDRAARMRSHAWFDVWPGDREVYLWGAPFEAEKQDHIRDLRDALTNERLLTAYDLSPNTMERHFDFLERFQPASIYGYPSSLEILSRYFQSQNKELSRCKPNAVFVTGEVCHPAQRAVIEEYFRCPVANGYGGREAGFIAHECPAKGMHVTAENIIVEVVRPATRADATPTVVPSGESGELVITHLDNYAMPFIRYRIGDWGRVGLRPCPCGRGAMLLEELQGRSVDHLRKFDGSIAHGLSVIYILRELRTIRNFQVHQDRQGEVTIRIIPEPTFDSTDAEYIRSRLACLLGDPTPVEIAMVEQLKPLASGKFRYIASEAPANLTCTV